MGWSIDLYRNDIGAIFEALGRKWAIQHPDTGGDMVRIRYEGEIAPATKKVIAEMFPDFVYVEFVPNSKFEYEPAEEH